ncbi:MAG: 23S rRNA (pseudouridine(1915)-N(3))-methyltransferase RlmH [Bacteroidetes bacterium]|nr:23S rRNA (pseudouridine(1915)-N(3))-methyltransferase RlmH [Bacteroidota bacterium]
MKITLLMIGKTEEDWLRSGIAEYESRVKHYIPFTAVMIPALKQTRHLSAVQQKQEEGELILKHLKQDDVVILLDEKGKHFSSPDFAGFIQDKMNAGIRNLVFIIGGSYGFDAKIYKMANGMVALSMMTFSHQMVRVIFMEQLYRAFTILRNEAYHH